MPSGRDRAARAGSGKYTDAQLQFMRERGWTTAQFDAWREQNRVDARNRADQRDSNGSSGGFGRMPASGPGSNTMPTLTSGGFTNGFQSSPPIPAPWDNEQPGAGGGVWGDAWDWIKDNPELILAGLGAINGARRQGKADDMREDAIAYAREQDAQRKPFRDAAQRRLIGPDGDAIMPDAAPDFSAVFSDRGNPYSRIQPGMLQQAMNRPPQAPAAPGIPSGSLLKDAFRMVVDRDIISPLAKPLAEGKRVGPLKLPEDIRGRMAQAMSRSGASPVATVDPVRNGLRQQPRLLDMALR